MSMSRVCPFCFRQEGIRANFGSDRAAEAEFHNQRWCKCGYSSSEEAMQDQDLGFLDPRWIKIAKFFLNEYYLRIGQGRIQNKDEHVRFFLKLLKSSASNYRTTIELTSRNENDKFQYIHDGKPTNKPKLNIFDNESDLGNLPESVVIDSFNHTLFRSHNQLKIQNDKLKKSDTIKTVIIVIMTLLIIVLMVVMFFG